MDAECDQVKDVGGDCAFLRETLHSAIAENVYTGFMYRHSGNLLDMRVHGAANLHTVGRQIALESQKEAFQGEERKRKHVVCVCVIVKFR